LRHDITEEKILSPNTAQESPQFPLFFCCSSSLLVLDLIVLDEELPSLLDQGLIVILNEVG
jgi:hypothetical protein